MPSFRAILKYRERYPHLSILVQTIGASLGIKYDTIFKKQDFDKELDGNALVAIPGVNSVNMESEKFKEELSLLDRPVDY